MNPVYHLVIGWTEFAASHLDRAIVEYRKALDALAHGKSRPDARRGVPGARNTTHSVSKVTSRA